MNTERLHSLIRVFIQANQQYNSVKILEAFQSTYTQSVQTPSRENAEAFHNAKDKLLAASATFPVGSLSSSRQKLLEAIGGTFYYGENLWRKIDNMISTSVTPSDTVAQIEELLKNITEFSRTVQVLDDSLTKLGVGVEDTPVDSAEIEVFIPQSMVDGHLNGFIKETTDLNAAFSDIREVVTGRRTPLDIRSLGSGSTELYLIVDLATGAHILSFVTGVVLLINSILQIRRDKESLINQAAPDKIIKDLKSWEDKRIQAEIEKLRDELLENYKGEDGRKNELRNALSLSLKRLADRIDRGMDIDVTTAATAEQEKGDESAPSAKQIKERKAYIQTIHCSANTMSSLERSIEPILQLPITDDDS